MFCGQGTSRSTPASTTASADRRVQRKNCGRPRRLRSRPQSRQLQAPRLALLAASDFGANRFRSCTNSTPPANRPAVSARSTPKTCRSTCPHLDDFKPHGRPEPPLDKAPDDWLYPTIDGTRYKRETNTMPQWAGSCWYYLRFLDPKNDRAAHRPRDRKGLDADRPLRRRRRARRAPPPLLALLAQGPLRPRHRQPDASRSRSSSTRA